MLIVVSVLLVSFFSLWLGALIYTNDFFVPTKKIDKFRHLLVVYPHPDDEALTAGGLMQRFNHLGKKVTLLIMTKGEKGTPNGQLDPQLKKIRSAEATVAANLLGVTELIHLDLGDGELSKKKSQLKSEVIKIVDERDIDLVITYDLTGLYGHPDHIALAEVITDLTEQKKYFWTLWYTSLPKKLLALVTLPEHMAQNKDFAAKRVFPTHKTLVGLGLINVIRTIYAYKSQFQSFRSSFPFRFIPLWFFLSLGVYEYFYEVKQ
jgi:LmbE family N-acetylglucosaminyl deacetylase